MGKHTPQMKIAQRKRQKARRKLTFINNSSNTAHTRSPSATPPDLRAVDEQSTNFPSGTCSSNNTEADNEDLGVDLDVVQMEIENPYQEHFSTELLTELQKEANA